MTTALAAYAGDSFGAPATSHQYGPYTVSSVNKVLRVQSTMCFSAEGGSAGDTSTVENGIVWGVQAGPTGYSPVALPGGLDSTSFFWAKLAGGTIWAGYSWAPSTDTGAIIPFGQDQEEWRGQLYQGETIDFYVSSASLVSGLPAWEDSWTLRVTYTD